MKSFLWVTFLSSISKYLAVHKKNGGWANRLLLQPKLDGKNAAIDSIFYPRSVLFMSKTSNKEKIQIYIDSPRVYFTMDEGHTKTSPTIKLPRL